MQLRCALVSLVFAVAACAQPARPKIIGVAYISLKTNDLAAARNFYGRDLGFAEPFKLGAGPSGELPACFKVNDHQYIEVFPELKAESDDRLIQIAFETTDARKLRDYLAGKGVKVPAEVKPDADGNLTLSVRDPEDHAVAFVEYLPGSLFGRNFGNALPASRISERIIHVGFTVQGRIAMDAFYKDILGFHEIWHGGKTDDVADWVDMRVPDGTDWLEYMLNVRNPSPRTLGVMNHLALGVSSVDAAQKALTARAVKMNEQAKIGRDGKWQLNLYDPNFTRAELMEPEPVQPPCCSPFVK